MTDLNPEELAALEADLSGARGPEQALAAEEWALANGYEITEDEWDSDEWFESEPEGPDEYSAVDAELANLENHIGRRLTDAEIKRIGERVPEQGALPNLVELVGAELKGRGENQATRRELMAEAAADASRKADEEVEDTQEAAPADESRDERVARMVKAGANATGGDDGTT